MQSNTHDGGSTSSTRTQGVNATSGGLVKATVGAAVVAGAILTFVWLPAEYGIDPTGAGHLLGLTEMGQIKEQLHIEADADAAAALAGTAGLSAADTSNIDQKLDAIQTQLTALTSSVGALSGAQGITSAKAEAEPSVVEASVVAAAPVVVAEVAAVAAPVAEVVASVAAPVAEVVASVAAPVAEVVTAVAAPVAEVAAPVAAAVAAPVAALAPVTEWLDELNYTLVPGQGIEVKLVMEEGAVAEFEWTANGAVVNHDTHGDGSGQNISYEKGRSVPDQTGELTAAFTGNHGWFWRNRTDNDVVLTLRTRGDYSGMVLPK